MKRGKKYIEAAKLIERGNLYEKAEAIALVKKAAVAKFDETIEAHIRTGCDGRHADQQIRGAVVLPHGTGKTVRILVFAKDAKAEEAKAAGADYVGGMELIEKIQKENWFEFDVVVATPDMMGVVGRIGRVLGPKGLMPNPKAGTVTMDVTKAVNDIKAGKIEYRLDKTNIIHVPVGKASFTEEQLADNFQTLIDAIMKEIACNAQSFFCDIGKYELSCITKRSAGCALRRRMKLSYATAAGARMCEAHFLFVMLFCLCRVSNLFQRLEGIAHFLPFGEKFIHNLRVGGGSTVQEHDSAWMDACEQLRKSLFFGWLLILIPVYIGKAPEEGFVSHILCHLEVGFAVFALRRAVEFGHFFTGDFFIDSLDFAKLLRKCFFRGNFGHVRM